MPTNLPTHQPTNQLTPLYVATYTNLENRPRMLTERVKRIQLSHKTGLPLGVLKPRPDHSAAATAVQQHHSNNANSNGNDDEEDEDDTDQDQDREPINFGAARPKKETTEEKKQRKELVKLMKKSRRVEKKTNKSAFNEERHRQVKQAPATQMLTMRLE